LHWKQKFDACGSLDALKDKISNLKKELAWAIISETERVSASFCYKLVTYQKLTAFGIVDLHAGTVFHHLFRSAGAFP